ncbi:hypothetical protein Tco_0015923 [Tanacetum coccineum]
MTLYGINGGKLNMKVSQRRSGIGGCRILLLRHKGRRLWFDYITAKWQLSYKAANEVRSVLREASTSRSFSKTRVMDVESDDGGDDDWTQSFERC